MAARYWRLTAIETYGGAALSLSEIALYAGGVRVDAPGSLTAVAPSTGTLADLQDGSAASAVSWSASISRGSGFAFKFDLGADYEVSALRFGAGGSKNEFVRKFVLESSIDGVTFTGALVHGDVEYPGANTLTGDVWRRAYPATMDPTTLMPPSSSVEAVLGGNFTVFDQLVTRTYFNTKGYPRAVAGVPVQFEYVQETGLDYCGAVGVALATASNQAYVGNTGSWAYATSTAGAGQKWTGGSFSGAYGDPYVVGDVIGVVLDGDNLIFYKNGVSQGVAFTGMAALTLYPICGAFNLRSPFTARMNLGGKPFVYPVAGAVPWAGSAQGVTEPFVAGVEVPLTQSAPAPIQPPTSVTIRAIEMQARAKDIEFGGNGMITGTVKVDSTPDVPVYRRVRLHRQRDALLVSETWSNPTTGAYAFTEISRDHTYYVVAFDYENNFRAVIADNLTPEAMS